MENYQLLVVNMAKQREEKDVKLVLNLFQALLDEFARSYAKREESEHQKVCLASSLRVWPLWFFPEPLGRRAPFAH